MTSTRDLFLVQRHTRLKVKGWKDVLCKWKPKKAKETTLMSTKIYFKRKTVTRNK